MAEVLLIRDLTKVTLAGGREGSYLAFDLKDLVRLIPGEGAQLDWAIMPFAEGLQATSRGVSLSEFEEALAERVEQENGVSIGWPSLVELAEAIYQTIWGSFVGCRPPNDPRATASMFLDDWCYLDRAKPEFYEYTEIAFQAVDSTFWLVYAKDESVRSRIRESFRDVETHQTPVLYKAK